MKNSQRGSTAVIVLVIIVIVLLGVIGWIYFKQPTQVTEANPAVSSIDTAFAIISPRAGDSWKIGGTYSVQLKNVPTGAFVQGWLEPKENAANAPSSFGVLETGRDGNPSSNIQVKVPPHYCGGECGALVPVAPGQYRLLLRVYPAVSSPSYQTYYSEYFSIAD